MAYVPFLPFPCPNYLQLPINLLFQEVSFLAIYRKVDFKDTQQLCFKPPLLVVALVFLLSRIKEPKP